MSRAMKPLRPPSPWTPIASPALLAMLGKAGEEAGELSTALCRAIIQGVDGVDPKTGRTNRQSIEDEVGDVLAACAWLTDFLGLDRAYLEQRRDAKYRNKCDWFAMLQEEKS